MLEEEVCGTVCTFWKSFWDLERNPPRHRPLRFYSPGERDRASYSVFYKTKHPQCYDLFCKALMTSSQESKRPLTLHFNFQQKNFHNTSLIITTIADCSKNTFTTLVSIVDCCANKFLWRKSLLSLLILSEKGEVHFWGNKGTIKRANNSDKLIRKIDETYFPTFSSCCPHNFFAESLLSCQSNHRQTGSKKNWFSFNFFSTKESAMQIYAKNSIWNIQKIVLRYPSQMSRRAIKSLFHCHKEIV